MTEECTNEKNIIPVIIITLEIHLNNLVAMVNFRYFNFSCIFRSNAIPMKEESP